MFPKTTIQHHSLIISPRLYRGASLQQWWGGEIFGRVVVGIDIGIDCTSQTAIEYV